MIDSLLDGNIYPIFIDQKIKVKKSAYSLIKLMFLESAMSISVRALPIVILIFVMIVLLNVKVYGSTLLLPASKTLPQKLLNIT